MIVSEISNTLHSWSVLLVAIVVDESGTRDVHAPKWYCSERGVDGEFEATFASGMVVRYESVPVVASVVGERNLI